MSDNKKICLVIPSLGAGGMERVMSLLVDYFSGQPYLEVHLIMYGIDPQIFYSVPANLIIHQPDWVFDNKKRTYHTFKRIKYLRSEIHKVNPSAILSFGELWNSFVLLALFGTSYPVFVSDRCQPAKYLGKMHEFLRKKLYPRSAGVIAQTAIAKEIFYNLYAHPNITVIGNPIRQYSEDINFSTKQKIVLSVGRLIDTKHHDILIKIFAKINLPEWKLIIVGGDAIKQNGFANLSNLISTLQMDGRVILTGNIQNVDEYYQKSSIFAFTSSSEGFPNVVGEAMSAGLPVVAFDCNAGPSDMIVNGKTGYLVPLFDEEMFRNCLLELMENSEKREKMGRASKEEIKRFSLDNICKQFEKFILE